MGKNKKFQFNCEKCRSNELGYQKYVKCVIPVSLQESGHMEYGLPNYDEDDYLATLNGFMCKACGSFVEHCGYKMVGEKEFKQYLTVDPEVRVKEQHDYEEVLCAQSNEQEQRENEQSDCNVVIQLSE